VRAVAIVHGSRLGEQAQDEGLILHVLDPGEQPRAKATDGRFPIEGKTLVQGAPWEMARGATRLEHRPDFGLEIHPWPLSLHG
jgi:hypothetical protein